MSISLQLFKKRNVTKKTEVLISVSFFLLLSGGFFLGWNVPEIKAGCSGQCVGDFGKIGNNVDSGNSTATKECCVCSTSSCKNEHCTCKATSCAASTCQGSTCQYTKSDCSTGTESGTQCCPTCNYISSYSSWDACHYDTGLKTYVQRGTHPNFSHDCGSGCPADAQSVRLCGVCNGAVPASSVAPFALTPCLGGGVAAMNLVSPNWKWNCLGGGGGSAAIGCSSSYIPVPTVSLTVNPASVNLNGGTSTISPKNVNLTWSITNSATACPNGCTCSASNAWAGVKTSSGTETVTISSGADPTYTLTCSNTFSGVSAPVSRTVVSSCTPLTYYDTCNVTCDSGTQACHHINSNCVVSACADKTCTLDPCPVTSEWREVKP
ncbi:MAG: hypothetical protein WC682_01555 [Parcubacteria group bacterium]|jgi:hypothetical protein